MRPTYDQINVFGLTSDGQLCKRPQDRVWLQNPEGMTWGEWYFSTFAERELTPSERAELMAAWRQGVDPSEYHGAFLRVCVGNPPPPYGWPQR